MKGSSDSNVRTLLLYPQLSFEGMLAAELGLRAVLNNYSGMEQISSRFYLKYDQKYLSLHPLLDKFPKGIWEKHIVCTNQWIESDPYWKHVRHFKRQNILGLKRYKGRASC